MGAKWGMVIYNCISAAEILLALVCISRVVYLEPGMSGRRNKILFAVAFLVPTLFVQICPGMSKDIFSAFPVCFFAVYMVIVRREKRIRGIFLTVPVLGFLMGIVSVFYAVPYTLTGKYPSEVGWLYAVDALFWIAVLIIYWKRDETVHLLRLDEPYRRLGKWERNFLHAAGVFLFVIGAMLMAVTQTGISGTAARVITGFGSLASVFLEMSVVILVWQGNQKDYRQNEPSARLLRLALPVVRESRGGGRGWGRAMDARAVSGILHGTDDCVRGKPRFVEGDGHAVLEEVDGDAVDAARAHGFFDMSAARAAGHAGDVKSLFQGHSPFEAGGCR